MRLLAVLLALALPAPAWAGAQQYEPLADSVRARLSRLVADKGVPAMAFRSSNHAQRWLNEMEKRIAAHIPDRKQRLELLRTVHYEATRARLDPQLVLGLIDGVRPREPVLLCLVGMLGSCLIAGSILATYPLLPWPISPLWFLGPLLIFPVCEGAAFLRYPVPVVPATEGVAP